MTEVIYLCKKDIASQIIKIIGIENDKTEGIVSMVGATKGKGKGEYGIPLPALNRFKKIGKNPSELKEIAVDWASKVEKTEWIDEAFAEGIYINFVINKLKLRKSILEAVQKNQELYGFDTRGQGKKIIVEFSSPNIAKPFHAGHLRSTIIGNFMQNLFRKYSYLVTSINWLGDWGKQYGLLGIGYEKYGSEEKLVENPIKHLYEIYVKINEETKKDPAIDEAAKKYFCNLEEGDIEATKLWKHFRDLSIDSLDKTYDRLNVKFDIFSGESLMSDGIPKVVETLEKKKLMVEDDGAQIIQMEKKLGKVVVKKKDGTTLYITRDIVAATSRYEEYEFDAMYYIVSTQQDLHFKQLFKILELMGNKWAKKCHHINFGMVHGMSTRKGTAIFLEDIMDEAKAKVFELMKKNEDKFSEIEDPENVADAAGIAAVVVQDMGAKRIKGYRFDWDRITQFEGYTGPFLLYAHARLSSIERKSGVALNPNADVGLLTEESADALVMSIGKYPQVLELCLSSLEPSNLVSYLFDLSHAVAVAHEHLRVKDTEKDLAEARLLLFNSARIVLASGLKLIGLNPLERM